MANNSSLPDFIPCGYNWTGPVMGETAPLSTDSQVVGYIACVIASIAFGSNFVPLKFVKTGDGFFCQWVMCAAIFLTGLTIQLIREQPIFFPMNLLGGTFWTIGMCTVVPIINLIGLSIGLLIWSSTNLLVGWATGRFGAVGTCDQLPTNEILNYVGVALCVLAGAVYIFVKTETKVTLPRCLRRKEPESHISLETAGVNASVANSVVASGAKLVPDKEPDKDIFLPNLPPFTRRILGICLALASGCCYGVQFLPAVYIQNHNTVNGVRVSQNGLDYVFAQYCGIFMSSTFFFIIYIIINRGKALIAIPIILPAIASGIVWGIGTICFFLANSTLAPAISFPIIATAPGMIGALYGIFLTGEIRGLRNYLVLCLAFALTIAGAVLTAFSK